jgi:hypothetical protein
MRVLPRRLCLPFSTAAAIGVLLSIGASAAWTEEAPGEEPQSGSDRKILWSTTAFGQLKVIDSPQDDDGRGGFFDQYDYTPNKDGSVAVELGIRDASLDWIEDRDPVLQFRYASPTSNLGVSGSDFDNAFFNQRALLLGRTDAFRLDVEYRRLRTEELRVFPQSTTGGGTLPFTDLTGSNDRFYRERTGFEAELRWRPERSFDVSSSGLSPELSVRGGYDHRKQRQQLITLLAPGNDWLAITETQGHEVGDVGAGLLVVPGDLLTVTLDFDYQKFESDNARLDDDLPFSSVSRSIGFVPSTDRGTGRLFAHRRFGDRGVVTAGFQTTVLEQQTPETPAQRESGFGDNKVLVYSAQLSGDFRITQDVSTNAFAKFVYRDNDIDRSSPLFNASNDSQVNEFLNGFSRLDAGAEARWRASRRTKLALGAKLLWIDRDLDYPTLGVANRVIQPENALVQDETLMWTFYVRADVRPLRSLALRSELSYRIAPDTGYITDLDDRLRGEIRGTYTLPVTRPATVSAFARGSFGKNSDFSFVEGLAPNPPGPSIDRDYKRSNWSVGLSGDFAWRKDVTFFGSVYFARDDQKDDLQLSNIQRTFQESVPLAFRTPGLLRLQSDELGILLGTRFSLSKRTDAGLAGSYTRAKMDYGESGDGRPLRLIDDNSMVDANIYGLDLEVRHRIRAGLRVFAGYQLQYFSDGAPKPDSPASVAQPPDRSDLRHTVSLGVTLNSELLERGR